MKEVNLADKRILVDDFHGLITFNGSENPPPDKTIYSISRPLIADSLVRAGAA